MQLIKAIPKSRPLSEIQRAMREQNAETAKMAARGVPAVRVPKGKRQ